jgi:uncharacterized protein with HEPN domain
MPGMRNRIAHGYFEIDLELVWRTIQTALPALLKQLEKTRVQYENENAGSGHSFSTSD